MRKGSLKVLGKKLSDLDIPKRHKSETISIEKKAHSIGIGYVIVPSDVDRDVFVKQCYNTGRVGIVTEYGGVEWDCLANKQIFNTLEFPDISTKYGSMVAFVRIPHHNDPIIIADLTKINETLNQNEDSFVIERVLDDCQVSISGNAKSADLTMTVTARGKNKVPKINLNINNLLEKGEFNVNADGKMNVEVSDNAIISSVNETSLKSENKLSFVVEKIVDGEVVTNEWKYEIGTGFSYLDEFENEVTINEEHHQIKPKEKFDIGEGSEPLVLGETLKGIVEDIIGAITKITVPTPLGPSGIPINVAEFESIKAQLDTFLSEYANTD